MNGSISACVCRYIMFSMIILVIGNYIYLINYYIIIVGTERQTYFKHMTLI